MQVALRDLLKVVISIILSPPSEKSLIITLRLILSPLSFHKNLKNILLISLIAWCLVCNDVSTYTSCDATRLFRKQFSLLS